MIKLANFLLLTCCAWPILFSHKKNFEPTLPHDKTSQFAGKIKILVGATDCFCCPMRVYQRHSHHRVDRLVWTPVFQYRNGTYFTRQRRNSYFQDRLGKSYTSHSLRIGAATTASEAGIPADRTRHLGRWRSDAHTGYVRADISNAIRTSSKIAAFPRVLGFVRPVKHALRVVFLV